MIMLSQEVPPVHDLALAHLIIPVVLERWTEVLHFRAGKNDQFVFTADAIAVIASRVMAIAVNPLFLLEFVYDFPPPDRGPAAKPLDVKILHDGRNGCLITR